MSSAGDWGRYSTNKEFPLEKNRINLLKEKGTKGLIKSAAFFSAADAVENWPFEKFQMGPMSDLLAPLLPTSGNTSTGRSIEFVLFSHSCYTLPHVDT